MGQVFVRRTTGVLGGVVVVLSLAVVALLVLLLAPPWATPGGLHAAPGATTATATPPAAATTTTTTTTATTTAARAPWETDYRIPRTTRPLHYDLYLHPDLEAGTFLGRVAILVEVTAPMAFLVAHVKLLNVTATSLTPAEGGAPLPLKEAFEYEPNQFWVVAPREALRPANYTLSLAFSGALDGSIVGFYRSVYTGAGGVTRSIATSKFQPTDARSAFPCFDEPSFKSTFSTTLVRPSSGYLALSNMPVESEVPDQPSPGLTEVRFQKSVPMVTYLACFIVCDFEFVETLTKEGKKFRVYATSDQIHRANYSLHLGVNVLNYFENYFQLPYPLPKQDMIAIPDFISGAMEHWGLITYRETNLLYDPLSSSSYNQMRVASVVAHELAHMWFGNLVTLEWWDDLWLNEGFASYIEYKGVANYEKDWDMEGLFLVNDLQRVMGLDAQLSSHPIVQPVNHPDEITEIFDVISYSKGASVLRMLENFMGEERFRRGVSNFLRRFIYRNAVTQDLWSELEQVAAPASPNITVVMDSWTRQMGYPVLDVTTAPGDKGWLEVRQERFLSDPSAVSAEDSPYGYRWDVPVTFLSDAAPRQQTWLHRDMDVLVIRRPPEARWVKFNVGQYGYYRVNYEPAMWNTLISLLKEEPESLSAMDRASLVDDAFTLASGGRLPYATALDLAGYLGREQHYLPWATAASHLARMSRLLRDTEAYPLFRKYVAGLAAGLAEQRGWRDNGTFLERRLRLVVLQLACSSGHRGCLSAAHQRLVNWTRDPDHYLPPNLRPLVYSYGIQEAGVEEWEVMLDRYMKEVNAQEKAKLGKGLANTRLDWVAKRLLVLAQNESVVRTQDFFSTLNNLAARPWLTHLVWSYVRWEWPQLVARFTLNNRYLGRMVKFVCTRFTSEARLQEMKEFFEKYPEAGSGARARQQALEEVEANVRWASTHAGPLHSWLLTHV